MQQETASIGKLCQMPYIVEVDIIQSSTYAEDKMSLMVGGILLLESRISMKYMLESVSDALMIVANLALNRLFNKKQLDDLRACLNETELAFVGLSMLLSKHRLAKHYLTFKADQEVDKFACRCLKFLQAHRSTVGQLKQLLNQEVVIDSPTGYLRKLTSNRQLVERGIEVMKETDSILHE